MRKKRTATESNEEDQTNDGSETLSRNENNAKRMKLDTLQALSDKTLQDLPIELLQMIIIKAVVMEVKDLKLAKTVWEEKAHELVVSRLKTVSNLWSFLLATNSFRKDLQRTLEGTAELFYCDISPDIPISLTALAVTTLNGEAFMLCSQDEVYTIEVYDLNNFGVAKDIFPLPAGVDIYMETCNVSNCLYVGIYDNEDNTGLTVFRISKAAEQQYDVSPWMNDQKPNELPISLLAVAANGSVIIYSDPNVVSVYDASGSLLHRLELFGDDPEKYNCLDVIGRSNGNLVLRLDDEPNDQGLLMEIDTSGSVIRQCSIFYSAECCVTFADNYDRYLITKPFKEMELLDCEMNHLITCRLEGEEHKNFELIDLRYDRQLNRIVRIHHDLDANTKVLTCLRFRVI